MDVLVVVATAAEAARLSRLPLRAVVSGVGPAAAALATQAALLQGPRPALVVSAGIGGAFPGQGLAPGGAAVASRMVYGDLGAQDAASFLPLSALGLEVQPGSSGDFEAWAGSLELATRLGLPCGPFVTVSTATGTLETAAELARRVPGALVEGMEGAGVAQAARLHGVPCTEIRGISNLVGPRDRASWQIGPALERLETVLARLAEAPPRA
ncbi:futalosine hydrolase [Deinococcus sonorensis]|uniref:Futalosine hydrolase n=2 Tax=Deinococcus sonorensis TaxID=309891 RepID=A0AAU7UF77_9DEIO